MSRCGRFLPAAYRLSSLRVSRLHRPLGAGGKLFPQCWRPVEIKQTLAGIVGCRGGFRQGAPLTAGDDSLKACARSFNVGHVGAHSSQYKGLRYLHLGAEVSLKRA